MNENSCLRVVTGHWPPYSISRNVDLGGAMLPVLQVLADKLDVCYKLVSAPAGGWGTRLPNGSWTGMIGMCERGEVDVVLGPIADSTERSLVIDFSTPLFIDKQIITYLRPTLEPDLAGFVKPFNALMWILLLIISVLVLGSTFLLLLLRFRILGSEAPSPNSGTRVPAPWHHDFPHHGYSDRTGRVLLWTYGVMITQSMWWFPRSMTGRVLGGSWLLAAFIIATVYKSNLKAMIIIPKVNLPFTTLEGMIEQDEMPYMLMGGSLVYDIFKHAEKDSLFGRGWEGHSISIWNYLDGLNNVLKEGYALIVDQNTVKNILHTSFSQTSKCPLWLTQEPIMSYRLSIGFPKASPLKDRVDPVIRRLLEHGLMDYWLQQELINSTSCLIPPGSETPEQRSLQLQDLYGVFCLYLAGTALSLLVFVQEVLAAKLSRRHLKHLEIPAVKSVTFDQPNSDNN
ncbi:glutamate receptor ionotropic, kainate 2-like [Penaeus chinensis]|uniref:glutamate receptor ionotropic, kainate 2-like n=1 Tax=Penaeus chinensis TaxID=139456 RepID=UPI001FB705FB|nr:glutamate receptor ionotropic, kainate 2-like [Penaeus chinensis]